jgi:flagellin-specific chaperone FliS
VCPECGTAADLASGRGPAGKGQATKAIEAAERAVGLERAKGVESLAADKLLDRAIRAEAEGRFGDAVAFAQAARRAVDIAKRRLGSERAMANAEAAIGAARKLGARVVAAQRALGTARRMFREADLKGADALARQARRKAEEALRRRQTDLYLRATRDRIAYAKERGGDVTQAAETMARAEEALNKGEYALARGLGREARSLAEDARKFSRQEAILGRAAAMVDRAAKRDVGLGEARKLLNRAREKMAKGLYAEAQELSAQVREAVKEAKRHHAAKRILDRALAALKQEERRGGDVGRAADLAAEGRRALEDRNYPRAKDLSKAIHAVVREAIRERKLRESVRLLEDDLLELRKFGARTEDLESLLQQARQALEGGDRDAARRLVRRARRAAVNAREAREREIVMATFEKIVARAGQQRVDAARARQLLLEVERAVKGGQVVDVDRLIDERLERIDAKELKDTMDRLDRIRSLLTELRRADVDVSGAEDLLRRAREAIDAGRYGEARTLIGEIEGFAEALRRSLVEALSTLVERAREAVAKAADNHVRVPEAEAMLRNADEARERDRLYDALEYARLATSLAERALKKHFETQARMEVDRLRATAERVETVRARIEKAREELETLVQAGMEAAAAGDALANAVRALEDGRVEEAEAYITAAEEIIEGLREALRHRVETAIDRARAEIAEARAEGVASVELEERLAAAEDALTKGQLSEALRLAEAVDALVADARRRRAEELREREAARAEKASQRLAKVRRLLESLHKMDIDVDRVQESLTRAESALEAGRYDDAEIILGEVEDVTRDLRAELVVAAKHLVSQAEETCDRAARLDVAVEDARETLAHAKDLLDKGEFSEAMERARLAQRQAEEALARHEREATAEEETEQGKAKAVLVQLRRLLKDLGRAEIEIAGSDEAMRAAEEAFDGGRYVDVFPAVEEVRALAESLTEGFEAAARDFTGRAAKLIEEAKAEELPVDRAEYVLQNARDALEGGRFVEAVEYYKVVEDIVEGARKSLALRELQGKVEALATEVEQTKAFGVDPGPAESLLNQARADIDRGRYDRLPVYVKELGDTIQLTKKYYLTEQLRRMETNIATAREMGLDTEEAEGALNEAQDAAERGDLEKIEVYVRKVDETLNRGRRTLLEERVAGDMAAVEEMIAQAEELGIEIREAQDLLVQAREAMEAGHYDSLPQLIADAKGYVDERRTRVLVDRYGEKLEGVSAMVTSAKRIGADMSEVERVLQKAQAALDEKDLSSADALLKEAEVGSGVQIQNFLRNRYPNLLLDLPTAGLQAGAWNRYVFEIANRGKIPARNVKLEFGGEFDVKGLEPIPEVGVGETKRVEIGIKPATEGEVPVAVQVFYQRYFDDNQYELQDEKTVQVAPEGAYVVEDAFLVHTDGRLIAHESRKFREQIDEDIFSGMLTVVQDFVKDSFRQRTKVGLKRLDFGDSKILIERSQHVFLATVVLGDEPTLLPLYMVEVLREVEERYGDVLEGWSGMLHELAGIDDIIKKLVLVTEAEGVDMGPLADGPVAVAARALRRARESGADVSDLEVLLSQAQRSLEQDVEKAWEYINRAKARAELTEGRVKERMAELLESAKEAIAQLRVLGADTTQAEMLLTEARTAFEHEKYEKVKTIVDTLRGSLDRAQREAMEAKIEESLAALIADVQAAKKEGLDISRAESTLAKIEEAIQKKDFRRMDRLLAQARTALDRQRSRRTLEQAKEEMDRLTAMLAEAKELGIEAKEAEELLLRSMEAYREGRMDDAVGLLDQARTLARERIQTALKDKYPRLFLQMATRGLQADAWNRVVFDVVNRGGWPARDVEIKFFGDYDVRGVEPIEEIPAEGRRRLEMGVRPKGAGATPLDMEMVYRRPLDDQRYETTESKELRVEEPGTYVVEDALLLHADGRVVVHESRTFRDADDAAAFARVVEEVQRFVAEAYPDDEAVGLRDTTIGERRVLVERGPHAFLVALVAGDEPQLLPLYMVDVLREVDARFGHRLASWSGAREEVEGVEDVVRRLLFVTEAEGADLGPLQESPIASTLKLVGTGQLAGEEGEDFVATARGVIATKGFAEAVALVERIEEAASTTYADLQAQLQEAIRATGETAGLQLTDEELGAYVDVVKQVIEAAHRARERSGIEPEWPVKRLAVKPNSQLAYDAVTSFRKIVVAQTHAKEFDVVAPDETWRGMKIQVQLDMEAITRAYKQWARKIEILLKSQDAWKIKTAMDRGEYSVGIEGQSLKIDPAMVWFVESLPDRVVEETFDHGLLYLDTEVTDEILAEGYATEIVKVVRDVRKEMGLEDDRGIYTTIQAEKALYKRLKTWKDFIAQGTGSVDVRFTTKPPEDGYIVECAFGDDRIYVAVKAAGG